MLVVAGGGGGGLLWWLEEELEVLVLGYREIPRPQLQDVIQYLL